MIFKRPEFLHGGDYNPDQWLHAPEVIDEDFRLMHKAGCNTMSVGIFSWSQLEPAEGRYDFSWLDAIVERMQHEGIHLILATPTGAKPLWLSEKYEETRRVTREGRRELSGGRHNHCWTSPVYREKVRLINQQLSRRYGTRPGLLLWHISNEYCGECFCPLCLSGFQAWLRDRYETLEALNSAYWAAFWSHRYSAWAQIDPRDSSLDGLTLDWRRFVSWQTVDFYRAEVAAVREHSQAPVTTNLMGFWEGIDYHDLARHLDVIADDSYPGYDAGDPQIGQRAGQIALKFDMLRCLKGKPANFFLLESCIDGRQIWSSLKLKPPGLHHLEMLQAVAHGADGTMYFQWRKGRGGMEKYHGAVVGHTHAEESRSFLEVSALSERYAKLRRVLPSLNRAETALLLDWESRWAYQASRGLPASTDAYALVHHAAEHHRPFWQRGAGVDVLASTDDFSHYKIVLVPRLYLLPPGLAARLRTYVENGGILVLSALTGMVDESNLCWADGCPGDGLEALAGVWMEEIDCLKTGESRAANGVAGNSLGLAGAFRTRESMSRLHLRDAETVLEYSESWLSGHPALTVRSCGSGKVYFFGADFDTDSNDRVYDAIIRQSTVRTFLPDAKPSPEGISVVARFMEGEVFWFLLNFSSSPGVMEIPSREAVDVETAEPVIGPLTLGPWQARVIAWPQANVTET